MLNRLVEQATTLASQPILTPAVPQMHRMTTIKELQFRGRVKQQPRFKRKRKRSAVDYTHINSATLYTSIKGYSESKEN